MNAAFDRSLIWPAAPALEEAAHSIWESRVDLREAYPNWRGFEFAKWIAVNGPIEYPGDVGIFYPPIPPEEMRIMGSGGGTTVEYLYSGVEDFLMLTSLLSVFVPEWSRGKARVLDFGCGCGRLSRWFTLQPTMELIGVELVRQPAEWCRDHLRGQFAAIELDPPLEIETGSIDLVYAVSVFSHLDQTANLRWFEELLRVCRPGATLVLTAHGAFSVYAALRREDVREVFQLSIESSRDLLRKLSGSGFEFTPTVGSVTESDHDGPTVYDQAFLTEAFARAEWGSRTEILGVVPAALEMFQDVYILRAGE